jgi:hypothetical protein
MGKVTATLLRRKKKERRFVRSLPGFTPGLPDKSTVKLKWLETGAAEYLFPELEWSYVIGETILCL